MKPILFNTEMVKAILEGRKTVTRRVIKPRFRNDESGFQVCHNDDWSSWYVEKLDENECSFDQPRYIDPPYKIGDILYVRETWRVMSAWSGSYRGCEIEYRAGGSKVFNEVIAVSKYMDPWKPSIHMPKKAARIFLKVTDVRVERLQDITPKQAGNEGVLWETDNSGQFRRWQFHRLWDSTIKKNDLDRYGWEANPWVWVIEFEKIQTMMDDLKDFLKYDK